MGLIARIVKAGSPDGNYVPGQVIQSAEVNSDFNQLYNLVDGLLDSSNILDGSLTGADLANSTITGAKIAPLAITTGLIADGAVTGAKIANAPNGVTTAKINDGQVTLGKMAVGAATRFPTSVLATSGSLTGVGTLTFGTLSGTFSGGVVLLGGTAGIYAQVLSGFMTINMVLNRDGSSVNGVGATFVVGNSSGVGLGDSAAIPTPSALDLPPAGVHVYTWQAIVTASAAGGTVNCHTNSGLLWSIEFA